MSNPNLDFDVYQRYMSLPLDHVDYVQVEYVWIGGDGSDLRSKTKTMKNPASIADIPVWNFDGSSTKQASGDDSEVLLRPVKMVPDPFRRGKNKIVLCECLRPDMTPVENNTRAGAMKIFSKDKVVAEAPWYGIEQEYTLFHTDKRTPLGWPVGGYPGPQGPYYCGVGVESAFGRYIAECHYRACLYAGIMISGINAEVMPGQWEFQIGPCEGVDSGDSLILSRYLMLRVCEDFGVYVSFDPKPIEGDWNGAGCHTNYSTKSMRSDGGFAHIMTAVKAMEKRHAEHIKEYGAGNERRLTGIHETAAMDTFSYGVANRGASVRIPRTAEQEGKGYLEDRRPASNMDPYIVTAMLAETTILLE